MEKGGNLGGRYFACVKKEEIPRLYAAYPLFDENTPNDFLKLQFCH